ncbi:MAG: DUF6776 family protein [Marinicella sp.]
MDIKTPKYVVSQANEKPSFIRQHWVIFSLLMLAAITFIVGRYSNIDVLNAFKGQKKTWSEINQQLSEENVANQKTISLLQTEAKIKQQAIIELQQNISSLSATNAALKADLVFYENLLSHKDGIKKLRVFEVSATEQNELILLKVVLAQKLEKARIVEGSMHLKLNGITADKGDFIDLDEQFNLDNTFQFKYFQIKKFTISLPKGFNPTSLLVELQSKNKKQEVVSELFQWSEIVDKSSPDLTAELSVSTQE